MRKLGILLGLALWVGAGAASAAPSFLGPTGLLTIPTADTLGAREWNVRAHGTKDLLSTGANLGIANRLELGFTFHDPDDIGDFFLVNAKYALTQDTENRPGLAIGVVDAFDDFDIDPSWYAVLSKTLTRPSDARRFGLRGHVGWGDGVFGDELFYGVELTTQSRVSALVDVVDSEVNAGLRFAVSDAVRLDLALFDDLSRFGGGVSYTAPLR